MIGLKCKICAAIFENLPLLIKHLNKEHHITKQAYYDVYFKQPDEGICKICGLQTKPNSYYGLKGRSHNDLFYHTYCSYKCRSLDPEIKEKQKNTNLRLYNHGNTDYAKKLRQRIEQRKIITELLKCKICNQFFNNKRLLSAHIRHIHNIKYIEYYNTYLKQPGEGICINCGSKTAYNHGLRRYSIYCSKKCAMSSPIREANRIKTNIKRFGVAQHLYCK